VFTGIADTLALVRLRLVVSADFSGELADELLVDTFHLDLGVFVHRDGETGRDRVKEWVGTAQGKVQIAALDGGAKTHTVDFQFLHKTLGYAEDHVLDEAAGSAVQRLVLALLGGTGHNDIGVL